MKWYCKFCWYCFYGDCHRKTCCVRNPEYIKDFMSNDYWAWWIFPKTKRLFNTIRYKHCRQHFLSELKTTR